MSYRLIDRNLKTTSVAALKSTEHDVTVTSFVADLSHRGLSNFYTVTMYESAARESAENLTFIFHLFRRYRKKTREGLQRRRILLSSTVVQCEAFYCSRYVARLHAALRVVVYIHSYSDGSGRLWRV